MQAGEHSAAEALWQRYYNKVIRVANRHLLDSPRVMADSEDVAISAFKSFFRAVEEGRTPQLNTADEIWRLLVTLTARKAIKQLRYENRVKRNDGNQNENDDSAAIENLVGNEPSPEFSVAIFQEFQALNERLPDDEMRHIAQRKMEGFSSSEIAQEIGCDLRTIQRRLAIIRSLLIDTVNEL